MLHLDLYPRLYERRQTLVFGKKQDGGLMILCAAKYTECSLLNQIGIFIHLEAKNIIKMFT
jgi:hypothetical protein